MYVSAARLLVPCLHDKHAGNCRKQGTGVAGEPLTHIPARTRVLSPAHLAHLLGCLRGRLYRSQDGLGVVCRASQEGGAPGRVRSQEGGEAARLTSSACHQMGLPYITAKVQCRSRVFSKSSAQQCHPAHAAAAVCGSRAQARLACLAVAHSTVLLHVEAVGVLGRCNEVACKGSRGNTHCAWRGWLLESIAWSLKLQGPTACHCPAPNNSTKHRPTPCHPLVPCSIHGTRPPPHSPM